MVLFRLQWKTLATLAVISWNFREWLINAWHFVLTCLNELVDPPLNTGILFLVMCIYAILAVDFFMNYGVDAGPMKASKEAKRKYRRAVWNVNKGLATAKAPIEVTANNDQNSFKDTYCQTLKLLRIWADVLLQLADNDHVKRFTVSFAEVLQLGPMLLLCQDQEHAYRAVQNQPPSTRSNN